MTKYNKLSIDHKKDDAVEKVTKKIQELLKEGYQSNHSDLVIVCVGTDRSTGDAFAPLLGTELVKGNCKAKVWGTLDNPVHAENLHEKMREIENIYINPFIIGVGSSLGQLSNVGHIGVSDEPLNPGAGVGKDLGQVGHMRIAGVVNVGGFMEYFVLQNTRLSLVNSMKDVVYEAIQIATDSVKKKRKTTSKKRQKVESPDRLITLIDNKKEPI